MKFQTAKLKQAGFFMMALVAGFAAFGAPTANAAAETTGASTNPQVAAYESSVLGALIDTAYVQNTLATICVAQESRAEVASWCATQVTTSQTRLDTLKGYLGDWYGNTGYTGAANEDEAAMIATLQSGTDTNFEADLLSTFTEVNKRAVAVSTSYLDRDCSDGSKAPKNAATHSAHSNSGCGSDRVDNAQIVSYVTGLIGPLNTTNAEIAAWRCAWYDQACS